MLKNTPYFTLNFKFVSLFSFFFCFFVGLSFAQGEPEKVILEDPIEKKSISKDSQKGSTSLIPNEKFSEKKTIDSSKGLTAVRKSNEGGIVDEPKAKKEEGSSTLSFNLFLYIVDKFKAD